MIKLPGINSPRRNSNPKFVPNNRASKLMKQKLKRTERRSRQIYNYCWRLEYS